ncbi:GntR family transcriptional regulator / MocR family aminotransferase [Dyadobacter koreensis]|uniref:GntR family transcriptional regulator / MocR family aminotransferase n=1 Tax=Dyadobacter koreensis TaxID=408657 RepID=A0A1H6YI60_9BACT|nr:PLP-dependent aminotransferase family protein [Dyadobacter koreensis]SEJ40096.1 GntR family transcriptional regulator / MocR family aminotransferase [Dyadobacter koreensis]
MYNILLKIDRDSSQPIYVQLANEMIQLIRSGVLKPGTKLPSIRNMAKELDVHPRTVVAAYDEIAAQDWICSKPRSGMIVAMNLPELKPINFQSDTEQPAAKNIFSESHDTFRYKLIINDGFPDHRIAPFEQIMKYYKQAFYQNESEKMSMYSNSSGSFRLRKAFSAYLGESRSLAVNMENILITRGAQMAIYLAASLLIKPGDEVLVGDPGYFLANAVFEQLGAKLTKIPVDQDGIDVDMIEKACKRKFKLLYIIPHHHHPTTVTLSAARRMKLISLIKQHQFKVIEDDYDYEFHYAHRPILPLSSAEHDGHVLYIGSVTKSLISSMRMGYLIAPSELISKATHHKQLMDIRGDLLFEDALANLYENGTMQRHIRKSLKLYQQRRDIFCRLLKNEIGNEISFKIPDGGMAVWVVFDKKYNLSELSSKAARQGLRLSDGSLYNSSTANLNAVRMGFASLDETEMIAIVAILRKIMNV